MKLYSFLGAVRWGLSSLLRTMPNRHIFMEPNEQNQVCLAADMQEQLLRTHSLEGTIEESSQNEEEDCNNTKQHHDPTGERRSVGGRRRGRRWVRRTGQRGVRGRRLRLWSLRRNWTGGLRVLLAQNRRGDGSHRSTIGTTGSDRGSRIGIHHIELVALLARDLILHCFDFY